MYPNDSQPSRANDIWRRFAGMFGADALERKFGAKPPAEWIVMLGRLNDRQIDQGIRRLAYSGKAHVPTLPEFTKLCRAIGGEDFDEGDHRPVALPNPDNWSGDTWDAAANRHLLGHFIKQITQQKTMRYGQPASYQMLHASEDDLQKLGVDRHYLDADGRFVQNVNKLIAAKRAWAADMRDLAVNGDVPSETQKAVWNDYINTAESQLR